MNLFVKDPEWGWWIILSFYFSGIAAGAYFTAALIDSERNEDDREVARPGYWVPVVLLMLPESPAAIGIFWIGVHERSAREKEEQQIQERERDERRLRALDLRRHHRFFANEGVNEPVETWDHRARDLEARQGLLRASEQRLALSAGLLRAPPVK